MPREENLFVHSLSGAKAFFSYINLQVCYSVLGGKTMKNFSFGGNAPVPPAGTCLLESEKVSSKIKEKVCGPGEFYGEISLQRCC